MELRMAYVLWETSLFTNIAFIIDICNEWKKRIFCFNNQCASGWHIDTNGWGQREYRYILE